jgi:hypothetical protein
VFKTAVFFHLAIADVDDAIGVHGDVVLVGDQHDGVAMPLEVWCARNARRDRVVPEDAMKLMAAKLVAPDVAEGSTKVTVVR